MQKHQKPEEQTAPAIEKKIDVMGLEEQNPPAEVQEEQTENGMNRNTIRRHIRKSLFPYLVKSTRQYAR